MHLFWTWAKTNTFIFNAPAKILKYMDWIVQKSNQIDDMDMFMWSKWISSLTWLISSFFLEETWLIAKILNCFDKDLFLNMSKNFLWMDFTHLSWLDISLWTETIVEKSLKWFIMNHFFFTVRYISRTHLYGGPAAP